MSRFSFGRVLGFPVWIEPTALFMLAFIVLPRAEQGGAGLVDGLLMAAIIFGSILVHELGHATVARAYRLGPIEIVLHGFGGLARFSRAPRPAQGVWVTLAGPGAGLALGLLAVPLLFVLDGQPREYAIYFVYVNTFWSLFNLLPMFPLDGGQVLLHALSTRIERPVAERWAARVGVLTAIPVAVAAGAMGQYFIVIVAVMALMSSAPVAFGRGR